jgi:hypothetical protein
MKRKSGDVVMAHRIDVGLNYLNYSFAHDTL